MEGFIMTKTLTQLVSAVQAQLIDDGTRFSTATCTAAIRSALGKLNRRIPINAEQIIDTIEGQYTYEPSGAAFITDVLQYFTTTEAYQPLEYDAISEDNRATFRLRAPLAGGLLLLARYTQFHTISGLDASTESTLTADQDNVLIEGACAEALAIRAASRIETINLQQAVSDNYREVMMEFMKAFEAGLRYYERRQAIPQLGRTTAWNDQYHGWTV